MTASITRRYLLATLLNGHDKDRCFDLHLSNGLTRGSLQLQHASYRQGSQQCAQVSLKGVNGVKTVPVEILQAPSLPNFIYK